VTPAPSPVDDVRVYEPSTRPGSPLPHAWIDDEDGNRDALRKLVAPGRFLLVAGGATHGARPRAGLPPTPTSQSMPSASGTSTATCSTRGARGSGTAGSGRTVRSPVRPDRLVAWRAPAASEGPRRALAEAFSQILARPVDAGLPVAVGAA
jgi:2,4-dichlorophenol 6-monooxygenase